MPHDHIHGRRVGRNVWARIALGVALAAAMVGASTAAQAQDSDGPSAIGSIMHALGFKNANDTYGGIDYNERSPLVVPPTRDLPPPVSSNAPPAPNWPKDADIERRKKAKKEEKPSYQVGDSVQNASRPLSRSELDPTGARPGNSSGDGDSSANSQMADPRDSGAKK